MVLPSPSPYLYKYREEGQIKQKECLCVFSILFQWWPTVFTSTVCVTWNCCTWSQVLCVSLLLASCLLECRCLDKTLEATSLTATWGTWIFLILLIWLVSTLMLTKYPLLFLHLFITLFRGSKKCSFVLYSPTFQWLDIPTWNFIINTSMQ